MTKIVENMVLAQAAQLELDGAIKSLEAATLRRDSEGVNAARAKAHDILDAMLDLKAAAMVEVLNKAGKG